jgi:hypothetical protein
MSRFEQLDQDKIDLLGRIDELKRALNLADKKDLERSILIKKQDSIILQLSTPQTKPFFDFNGLETGIQTLYAIDGTKEFHYYAEIGAGVNIWNFTTRGGLRIPLNRDEQIGLYLGIQYNFFKK